MVSILPASRYKEYKGETCFTIRRKGILEEMLEDILDRYSRNVILQYLIIKYIVNPTLDLSVTV
jgi:hypothetical protein